MLKRILKRYLSLTLALVMVLSLLPGGIMTAYAATTLSGLTVDDLSVEYTNGDWSASGNTINGSATGESGTCSSSATTATLVLTNKKTSTAKLMFNYTVTLNSGSVTVGGTSVSSDGTYSYSGEIEDDGTLQIVLKSASGNYTSYIEITDIYLLVDAEVTTTFAAAENGSYTVNGTEITDSVTYTQSSTTSYSLVATPADGYQFLGWYSTTDKKYLSTSASTSLYLGSDQTVTAVFGSASAAVFETGGGRFTDLNEAVAYAQKMSASIITLIADGSLPAGSYTIPSGIILLIPFDEAGTCYTTEPGVVTNANSTPTAYRTLTMEDGASIEVYGGISVSAKASSAGSGANGTYGGSPTDSSGRIVMNSGSSITVKSGGSLYAWGFITGSLSGDKLSRGTITAESGATVYECFQIADFRGGSATSTCVGDVFPFSQWYVQNIEVPLTLCSGATENVFTALYAASSTYTASFTLIAQNSGMFQLTGSDTTLVKSYDPTTDRLTIDVNGDAKVGSISMKVAGVSINSADYILPVNSNITLNINSGTTTVSQDIKLLPGVQVSIAGGATLDISSGSQAIIYDSSDWVGKGFVYSSNDLKTVVYSPTKSCTRTSSDLTDVTVDVNGTINVNGSLYTTSSGAAITSSQGSGKVILNNSAPSSTTINEMANNSTITTVSVTSAQLLNGDGTYTATEGTAAGKTFTYDKSEEKWVASCTTHTAGETVIENEVAATCTESGSYDSVVYCTVCGEEISRETIVVEATGHSYTSEVTAEATCTEDGVMTYTCSVCGDTYTETISALGHDWGEGEITTAATCTEEGVLTYTCSRCGETKTEAISATGHTVVVDEAVAATCTESGLTEGSHCSVCGAIIVEQEVVPALGHDYTSEVTKEATCTEDGVITYTCTRCGDTYTETISATGHSYDAVVTAPTCTEQGYTTYTCSVCGDSYVSNYVDALGHSYDEGVVTKEATCTEDGVMTYTCTVCGETKTDTIAATGHSHVGEVTKEATCTEDGVMTYTCTKCGDSYTVTIPATGHTYVAVVTEPTYTTKGYTTYTCTVCGDSYIADETDYLSGWATTDEGTQYYEGGSFKTGLTTIDGELYYFDESGYAVTGLTGITDEGGTFHYYYFGTDFKAYRNGTFEIDGADILEDGEYTFDENGILQLSGWVKISGEVYYYDPDTHTSVTGVKQVPYPTLTELADKYGPDEEDLENHYPEYQNAGYETMSYFVFDSSGVFQSSLTGIYTLEDGTERWVANGELSWHGRLVTDGTDYYYVSAGGTLKRSCDDWIGDTNDLLPQGVYTFGDDAKIIMYNGFVTIDGTMYYYVNGRKDAMKGLFTLDSDYYYVTSELVVLCNCYYYVSNTNDLLPAGTYYFGADGKMVIEDTSSKNGLIEEDGELYYYVDGVKTHAGLIEVDGNYYYINSSCKAVRDCDYYVSNTNDLMPKGTYHFDEDGKMVIEDTSSKNGLIKEDGELYYYVDGVKTHAGLIEIDGDYYYINSSCKAVRDCDYYVSNTNGLMTAGTYHFDEDGKMVIEDTSSKNGLIEENGELYYYVDGVKTHAGLIEIDGDYYYINSSCKAVRDCDYYVSNTNDLMPKGTYHFDEDGKMVLS